MSYLLDSHTFLWSIFLVKKLSKSVKSILIDPKTVKYISLFTFWEISLKFSLGKLDLKDVLPDEMPLTAVNAGFEILNLDAHTISSYYKLPKTPNKDPFDRMLAWQAICQNYCLITKNKEFSEYQKYGLKTVW